MIRYLFIFMALWSAIFTVGCDSPAKTAGASQSETQESPGIKKDKPAEKSSQTDKSTPVQVLIAEQEIISKTIELTGEVVATNKIVIRNNIDGTVIYCPLREGDTVKKGQRVVEIDRPIYREEVKGSEAALSVARARLANLMAGARKEEVAQAAESVRELESCTAFTKNDMERIQQLVKSGAVPEENLEKSRLAYIKCETGLAGAREKHKMLKQGPTPTDIAVQKALVREAEAKEDMSRARLAECILFSPFDGVVTKVDVRVGDTTTAKSPLLTLMETTSIVVRFSVPEAYSYTVDTNTPVSILFDALPEKKYTGKLIRFYPEIDSRTRTRTVEAQVEPLCNLAPGMFARIELTTESSDKGIAIPDRAVLKTPEGKSVAFLLQEDNTVEQRNIVTGIEAQGMVQILSGINQGEKFIASGNENLKNGTKVKESKEQKQDGQIADNNKQKIQENIKSSNPLPQQEGKE